jgi:predicted HTH transcriptional regulator
MDAILFEQLLYQEESNSLDFKRDQYPFDGASDDVKSELLKDILAFANSWKRVDAYILVGVEDNKGGKSVVVGVTDDLDDAKSQQFVNSKTNKPLAFSYEPFIFDGKGLE